MSKFKTLKEISLKDLRMLLKQADYSKHLALGDVIDYKRLDASSADELLRKIAEAGYLIFEPKPLYQGAAWTLTDKATQLVVDKLKPPIERAEVDDILNELLKRVALFNESKEHLICISRVRLYGSTLSENSKSFGDVDVEIAVEEKFLQDVDAVRIKAKIAAIIPNSYKEHPILKLNPEYNYDKKLVLSELKKGLSYLSIMEDQISYLGCDFKTLYAFDPVKLKKLEASQFDSELKKKKSSQYRDASKSKKLPSMTAIAPINLPSDDKPISLNRAEYIGTETISGIEGRAWAGVRNAQGNLDPIDIKNDFETQFSGSQHLCDVWKKDLPGMEILMRSLDWAKEKNTVISGIKPTLTLRTYPGTRIANFREEPLGSDEGFHLMVERVSEHVKASLLPAVSEPVTRNEVAANYSVAMALGKLLDETELKGPINFKMEFDLSIVRKNRYEVLPSFKSLANKLKLIVNQSLPYDSEAKKKAEIDDKGGLRSLPIERILGLSWDVKFDNSFAISVVNGAEEIEDCVADPVQDAVEAHSEAMLIAVKQLPGLQAFELMYSERPKSMSDKH